MITRFHIENFKSLMDFDLPPDGQDLSGFTCLIGLNGAGKSTLLQAFDFVAQVAAGDISGWLERREWKKSELLGHGSKKPIITFKVTFRSKDGIEVEWQARFNVSHLRCTMETITTNGRELLKVDNGALSFAVKGNPSPREFEKVPFEYQGSVLSSLSLTDAEPAIAKVKTSLRNLCSLELLSPQLMRKKARLAQDIGVSGEKLSPFLHQLKAKDKGRLWEAIRQFYPRVLAWNVKGYRGGWKQLRVMEDYGYPRVVGAGHINDGFLRVIAILSQTFTSHEVLLLDEIENGINPALVEELMRFLVSLGTVGKQVIVTTHSPVILNFLEDEIARQGVILLYRTEQGDTKSCRYFDQPETTHKLRALGPGEVFVDTDLTKMADRLGHNGGAE
jgi:predicted ATPase